MITILGILAALEIGFGIWKALEYGLKLELLKREKLSKQFYHHHSV